MRHLISIPALIGSYLFTATLSHAQTSSYNILPDSIKTELQKCDVDSAEFGRLMALSQKGFDQDFQGGWRTIDEKDGCSNAAGELLKAYILYSAPHAPKSLRTLRWHAGQVKAGAGQTNEAIAFFAGSYNPDPDKGKSWNLYVDATIAFLRRDKAALQTAHDTLAAMPVSEDRKASRRKFLADNPNITLPKGFIDEPLNLAPVRDFLTCFDQPYSIAYGNCNQ